MKIRVTKYRIEKVDNKLRYFFPFNLFQKK